MERIISFGKLLNDPTRLKIIKLLLSRPMCVCELMEVLRLNQPCVSQHLRILKSHRLLKAQRNGKWIVYQIDAVVLKQYFKEVKQFLKVPLVRAKELKSEHKRFCSLTDRGLIHSRLKVKPSRI